MIILETALGATSSRVFCPFTMRQKISQLTVATMGFDLARYYPTFWREVASSKPPSAGRLSCFTTIHCGHCRSENVHVSRIGCCRNWNKIIVPPKQPSSKPSSLFISCGIAHAPERWNLVKCYRFSNKARITSSFATDNCTFIFC